MDILDILLDDEPVAKKVEAVVTPEEEVEGDIDLLLEEYASGDLEAKKASLRTLISLIKR